MAGNSDSKPDSPLSSSVKLDTHLPSKEDKYNNLSGHVEPKKLRGKYEVLPPEAINLVNR